jgi:RNA-directed DNA polymerase
MAGITAFLEPRLKLKVHAEKSAVARPWQRKFLGYRVWWHQKPKLKIAPSSRQGFAEKIGPTLRGARGQSLRQVIDQLNPVLRGWVAYFRLTEERGVWEELDGWIRRKLRTILWRHWKRPLTRTQHLLRMGIEAVRARQSATHGRGPLVERRRRPPARSLSSVLLRPHGFALAVGYSAPFLVGFMNRPLRNRTAGRVGGRRE